MAKYYLDEQGLERLVSFIKDELSNKVNIGDQVELPNNLIYQEDLVDYAKLTDIPEQPDLSPYALQADLVDYALADDLNNYATIASLDDYATNDDLDALEAKVTGVYHFKGNVENLEALQAIENPEEGDVYNIVDTGMNAAWNGEMWDEFGTTVDLSDYAKLEDVQAIALAEVNRILYSGNAATVSDRAGIVAMINNDEPEVEITLNKNLTLTSYLTVPEGKDVTLDLNGNTITASTAAFVQGGNLTVKNGTINTTSTGIAARGGATVTVENANITSSRSNGITATESDVIVESGSITSQEAGVVGFKDSNIIINGGVITGIDNGPIMGNGSAAGSQNDGTNMNVVMNGGTLIAHIQSAGYVACGVYVPNSGSFTMNGGEIISDGAGIVMRGGQVNLNGGRIVANGESGVKGKVGDSRIVVGPYAIVYDAQSRYPAMDTLELNIASGMILEGTDGDIDYILENGVEANVTDNR